MTMPFRSDNDPFGPGVRPSRRGQFLRIRRRFVETYWRDLYLADGGATASLLVVLLSLCWGHGTDGVGVLRRRIARLTGVNSSSALSAARDRLHRNSVVLKLPSRRRGIWQFRDGGVALAGRNERGRFIFPTGLVHNEDWALLSAEARAVLIALASVAKPIWNESDIPNGEWESGDGVREPFVRSAGKLDFAKLADLTGIDKDYCEDAIDELSGFGLVGADAPDFCLPDDVWYMGYAAQRERLQRNRRPSTRNQRQSASAIESMLPLDITHGVHSDWY